jgi:hypothetical protein
MRIARLLLIAVAALLIAAPLSAQEKKAKPERKGPAVQITGVSQAMVRMMKLHEAVEAMDLSADQEKALEKMHKDVGPKMGEIMKKLGEILTDEQEEAAKEAGKKAKEAGKQGRMMAIAVEKAVNLTDEQKKKLEPIGKKMLAMQREILKKINTILTEEQQKKLKAAMAPKPGKKAVVKEKK